VRSWIFIWDLFGFVSVDSNLNWNSNLNHIVYRVKKIGNLFTLLWAANLTFSPLPLSAHAWPTNRPSPRRPPHHAHESPLSRPHSLGRHLISFFLLLSPLSSSSLSASRRRHGKAGRAAEPTAARCLHVSRGASHRPLYLPPAI
jgi:hypothetical protein